MNLPAEDVSFLIQFVENCEAAKVLWRIGKQSDGLFRVVVLLGDKEVAGQPMPKLHQAIKACVETAAVMGAATSLIA